MFNGYPLHVSMACRLSDVVGIMNMDGFTVNKTFYCKEYGLLENGDATTQSSFFDLGLRWNDLSPKDRGACKYVESFVHRIPLACRGVRKQFGVLLSRVLLVIFTAK